MRARANRLPVSLSRSSPEPLYRQLSGLLEETIHGGTLKPGDRLPSEGALMQRYGVSRITLRQAVAELVRKQIVLRKQGKGTFVTAPTVQHDLKHLHGMLGSLFSQADGASARLLRHELSQPPEDIGEGLGLSRGEKALAFERLYLIGGRPVALTEAWLAPAVAALPRMKVELVSTEDMMRAVGIGIASTQVAIRAQSAGARVSRLLTISPRSPVLELSRKAFTAGGAAKEIGRIWFCSDRYQLAYATQSAGTIERVFDIRKLEPT